MNTAARKTVIIRLLGEIYEYNYVWLIRVDVSPWIVLVDFWIHCWTCFLLGIHRFEYYLLNILLYKFKICEQVSMHEYYNFVLCSDNETGEFNIILKIVTEMNGNIL